MGAQRVLCALHPSKLVPPLPPLEKMGSSTQNSPRLPAPAACTATAHKPEQHSELTERQFPRRGTTASPLGLKVVPSPRRPSGQDFARVPQVGLKRLGPHVRRPEPGSWVCKEPPPLSGQGQLPPPPPLPPPPARAPPRRPPPPPPPGASPPRFPPPGPTSRRAAAPRSPRRSSGAPGRAGAAGGGGPGRHGPRPSSLQSAGPLPAPGEPRALRSRARRPAAAVGEWRAGSAGCRVLPAGPRAPPPPPARRCSSELIRSWRAPGRLPRQRLSQGRADSSGSAARRSPSPRPAAAQTLVRRQGSGGDPACTPTCVRSGRLTRPWGTYNGSGAAPGPRHPSQRGRRHPRRLQLAVRPGLRQPRSRQ
ncbi:basic salivary proline-rich protein 3-like [Mustela putorius furo]|uniref:Basic salivary proline-rich protein 3-like n=1 Tax=Mustela putorius furo TaxID=9669 RepID=A0A8U0SMW6_MUSPF|nr:basic salivary proline-rich protein 3-like [Mustela putorius furo]